MVREGEERGDGRCIANKQNSGACVALRVIRGPRLLPPHRRRRRVGESLVAATLSAGIVLTSAQHKYVARSPGLPRKVVCDAGGSCPKDKLRRAVGSFLAAGGAGRRLGDAPWMEGGGRSRAKCREHD